jgi:hypothetical protein
MQVFNIRLSRKMVEEAVMMRERLPPGTRRSRAQLEKSLASAFQWWCRVWQAADRKP